MPDITFIKAGTLDDTSWLDPKMHVYCDSAQRWTPIPDVKNSRRCLADGGLADVKPRLLPSST
jgi:hypothetical protein